MTKDKYRLTGQTLSPLPPSVPPGTCGEILTPTASDVLCGRGDTINNHEGNLRFRELVNDNKHVYLAETSKRIDKAHITANIVQVIRDLDPPGRFLKKVDGKSGMWIEIGDEKARKKTSQALREDAPEIRNEIAKVKKKASRQEKKVETNHGYGRQGPLPPNKHNYGPRPHPHHRQSPYPRPGCYPYPQFNQQPYTLAKNVRNDENKKKIEPTLFESMSTLDTDACKELLSLPGSNLSHTSSTSVKLSISTSDSLQNVDGKTLEMIQTTVSASADSTNTFKSDGGSGSFTLKDQEMLQEILMDISDNDLSIKNKRPENAFIDANKSNKPSFMDPRIGKIIMESSRSLISILSNSSESQNSSKGALHKLQETLSYPDRKGSFSRKDLEILMESLEEVSKKDMSISKTESETNPTHPKYKIKPTLLDPGSGKSIGKPANYWNAKDVDNDDDDTMVDDEDTDTNDVDSEEEDEGKSRMPWVGETINKNIMDVNSDTNQQKSISHSQKTTNRQNDRKNFLRLNASLKGSHSISSHNRIIIDGKNSTKHNVDHEHIKSNLSNQTYIPPPKISALNKIMCFQDVYKFPWKKKRTNDHISCHTSSNHNSGGSDWINNESPVPALRQIRKTVVESRYSWSTVRNNSPAEKALPSVREDSDDNSEGNRNEDTETKSHKSLMTITTDEMNDMVSLTSGSVANLLRAQQMDGSSSEGPSTDGMRPSAGAESISDVSDLKQGTGCSMGDHKGSVDDAVGNDGMGQPNNHAEGGNGMDSDSLESDKTWLKKFEDMQSVGIRNNPPWMNVSALSFSDLSNDISNDMSSLELC